MGEREGRVVPYKTLLRCYKTRKEREERCGLYFVLAKLLIRELQDCNSSYKYSSYNSSYKYNSSIRHLGISWSDMGYFCEMV